MFGPYEKHLNDIADDLFKRLAVLLVHAEQESRKHNDYHADRGSAYGDLGFQKKKQRDADQRPATETNELSLGQIKENLCLDSIQVFRNRNISHSLSSSGLMGVEHTLGQRAGLKEREAEQDGVAHARPDRGRDIGVHYHVLNEYGIDRHTNDD